MFECCSKCIDREFRAENIGLNGDNPSDFVKSQWPVSHKVYVAYRLIISLLFLVWLAADAVYETQMFFRERPWSYLIYATNWSFILLTATVLFMGICTLYYSLRSDDCLDRQTFERMPRALKCQWFMQNLSYNSAVVVTISFWSFILLLSDTRVFHTRMSLMKHTLNTVYVIVDIMISATPIRILHLFYSVGLGSVYALFNAIYFLNDGTILEGRHFAYNVLDWNKPAEAIVTCILCVVICVFSQIIIFEVYKFRMCLYTKIFFNSESEKPEAELQSIISEQQPAYSTMQEREPNEEGE